MVKLTVPGDILAQVQEAVAAHQPELNFTTIKDILVLEGLFVVSAPEGAFDSFQVKIGVSAGFPWEEPVVFEAGNRIPKVANRHVFPEHGNCCLGVWEEWLLTAPTTYSRLS